MRVFSKSARCPNNEIPSCEKACAYGISDKPTPSDSGQIPLSYAHKSNFQRGVIQLQLELGINARNLSTPIHTLLMPTFFGLNLGI